MRMDPRSQSAPSPAALLVLVVAALAIVATSPAPPSLESYAIGEVLLDGTQPVERELRLHLDPRAAAPSAGSIILQLQAAHGLGEAWPLGVSLALVGDDGPPPPASTGGFAVPIERCEAGCDLAWRVVVTPTEAPLPGSIVRFEADARLDFYNRSAFDYQPEGFLSLSLQDAASGPPAAAWSVLAGILAFGLGVLVAGRLGGRLGGRRRAWPATALLILLLAWIALRLARTAGFLLDPTVLAQLGSPLVVLEVLDPWPLAILGTLAWGLWLGIRRWRRDGGWCVGLAAVATAALGGLWLVWDETSAAVFQPELFAIVLAVPTTLAGIVLGQAWRSGASSHRDLAWAAVAVVAHGIVIAGFGFLAAQGLSNPFQRDPAPVLSLVPAALVTLALARWLRGGRRWLILFDLLVAAAGVLGLFFGQALRTFSTTPGRVQLGGVGIGIAVGAGLVALGTGFHRLDRGRAVTPEGVPPPARGLDPATS